MNGRFRLLALGCALFAAAAAGAQPQSAAETVESDYRLGPEDKVQIRAWGRADLSGEAVLDAEGRIQLPLLGSVDAEGRTVTDLGAYLTRRYRLLDPSIPEVIVSVSQYNSRSVSVLGEVRDPGRHGFKAIPDLWSVLLAAGGGTAEADLSRVQIVRHDPAPGEPQALTVDLSRGIGDPPRETLPALRPQDTVIVPARTNRAVVTGDKVHVLGAVHVPGAYQVGNAERLVEAISASGGPLPNADLRHVSLTRASPEGAFSYELDLRGYLYHAEPLVDLELLPGDIVTVPSRKSTIQTILDGMATLAPFVSVAFGLGYALR